MGTQRTGIKPEFNCSGVCYSILLWSALLYSFFNSNVLTAQADTIHQTDNGIGKPDKNVVSQKPVQHKPAFAHNLPGEIKETSGLLFYAGALWTINDSGNLPVLYETDTATGKIVRSVVISNASNVDWESITQDDSSIYIGDFGNNPGNRTDLHILKISKSGLHNPGYDTIKAGYINFSYPDQLSLELAFNCNNFDCEAMFYEHDSLHLLSKNWSDQMTKHYVLPATCGNYQARLAEQFNANGLITDAAINKQGNIVLLGYKNTGGRFWNCFCWVLSEYSDGSYFNGRQTRIELGSVLHLGQSEGITLNDDNSAWLSSESIRVGWMVHPAKLFRLKLDTYFEH